MMSAPAAPVAPAADPPPVETEAKLHASRRAFDALAEAPEVAGWRVAERRDTALRDTYWDTPDGRLARAGSTLRVRQNGSDPQGELTLKGPVPREAGSGAPGAWSRTELSVAVPAGSGPPEWATIPAAQPVLDALRRLGAAGGLRPDVVLRNPRRDLLLRQGADEVVLSLDEVALEGAPYRRRYVEAELKKGRTQALQTLVEALVEQFGLRPSRRAKAQAAREWLARQSAVGSGGAVPGKSTRERGLGA
jgi:triphosphatase